MENRIRSFEEIAAEVYDTENVITDTSSDQVDTETIVLKLYKQYENVAPNELDFPIVRKKIHGQMLKSCLRTLPNSYECLDASRTWLVYWILHSLWLLNDMPDSETQSDVVHFLSLCQHEEGGFGGGPGQYPHLGTTYAAVNALSIIATEEAYNSLDRSSLQKFLWTVRGVDGSFALHKGGEHDIRGAYCAVSIAKVTNTYTDDLFDKTAEWIIGCQTYEGGFAGCPGMEAHGGYAFCAIAALALLNKTQLCDIDALLRWCVNRQMRVEGGFQGRTNKLVDGCYSFWQGAALPIISAILSQDEENKELIEAVLFDQGALQEYIIICCQALPGGGFIDKPGKYRDIYHTCYALSGLSIAQHGTGAGDPYIVGRPGNELNRTHPLYNVAPHLAYNALHYFIRHPPPVKDNI